MKANTWKLSYRGTLQIVISSELIIPRPYARKVVIQASRQNIPWETQLKIFQHSSK
jgi:hypothetical protein